MDYEYQNPGEEYYYDWRSDPRYLSEEDANPPDIRGVQFRADLSDLEEE